MKKENSLSDMKLNAGLKVVPYKKLVVKFETWWNGQMRAEQSMSTVDHTYKEGLRDFLGLYTLHAVVNTFRTRRF